MASDEESTGAVRPLTRRRGRPRAGEQAHRREAVLDAAEAELALVGHEKVTMLGIARRAGASKETLYSWFQSKDGLFQALVEREIHRSADRVREALAIPDPNAALEACARALLERTVTDTSVALRRAAASSAELGPLALAQEEALIDTPIEAYLTNLARTGPYLLPDPASAGRLFRSLVLQDLEVHMLLGEHPISEAEVSARVHTAVDHFLALIKL